jgi:hypothetical protein
MNRLNRSILVSVRIRNDAGFIRWSIARTYIIEIQSPYHIRIIPLNDKDSSISRHARVLIRAWWSKPTVRQSTRKLQRIFNFKLRWRHLWVATKLVPYRSNRFYMRRLVSYIHSDATHQQRVFIFTECLRWRNEHRRSCARVWVADELLLWVLCSHTAFGMEVLHQIIRSEMRERFS